MKTELILKYLMITMLLLFKYCTTISINTVVPYLDLPVTLTQCMTCASWLDTHFGDKAATLVAGTPLEKGRLYAIAYQETAIYWCHRINDHAPDQILARCVFDASGDTNGTRIALPKNTAAFIEKFGQSLAYTLRTANC